jgi:hypothetical protein
MNNATRLLLVAILLAGGACCRAGDLPTRPELTGEDLRAGTNR